MSLPGHFGEDRADGDVGHLFELRIGHNRGRAVGAHTPGIGAGVAVENGLVVLRGRQREGRFPVAERQQRHFLAHQKFFDDHTASGRAEHAAHDLVERFERLFLGLGHDDALARRKAVRLDDDGRALFFHKGLGGFQFGEHAAGGGRNPRFLHDVLGESFAALKLRAPLARAEAADARLSHGVHDAEGEGKLRPGNHEINDVSLGKRHQTGDVAILQGDVFAFLRGPAVAGSTVDFLGFSASGDLPRQSVFASAGPDDEHAHVLSLQNIFC